MGQAMVSILNNLKRRTPMLGMLVNLNNAVVAVAETPVTLAVDVLAVPFDADNKGKVFTRTSKMPNEAGENVTKAVDSDDRSGPQR
jgi:hypothetical protein